VDNLAYSVVISEKKSS